MHKGTYHYKLSLGSRLFLKRKKDQTLSLSITSSLYLAAIHGTFRNRCIDAVVAPSCLRRLPLNYSQIHRSNLTPVHSTDMQESIETSKGEPGFVEIGYICRVHGLQGEVRVKPNTDFPELRFSKPGRRWLRQEVSGRETIQELELLAEKLAEEDAERKVKGEAKKEKLLVGGKGHVKPANFLDSHEKFLIGVATKSSDQAI